MARGTLGEMFGIFGKSSEIIGVRISFEQVTTIDHPWGPEFITSHPSVTINALASDTIAEVRARADEYAASGRLGERHGGSPRGEITGSQVRSLYLGGFTDPAIRMA